MELSQKTLGLGSRDGRYSGMDRGITHAGFRKELIGAARGRSIGQKTEEKPAATGNGETSVNKFYRVRGSEPIEAPAY